LFKRTQPLDFLQDVFINNTHLSLLASYDKLAQTHTSIYPIRPLFHKEAVIEIVHMLNIWDVEDITDPEVKKRMLSMQKAILEKVPYSQVVQVVETPNQLSTDDLEGLTRRVEFHETKDPAGNKAEAETKEYYEKAGNVTILMVTPYYNKKNPYEDLANYVQAVSAVFEQVAHKHFYSEKD